MSLFYALKGNSKELQFANASMSDSWKSNTSKIAIKKRSREHILKIKAKKIKSDNFTKSKREASDIAIDLIEP